MEFGFLLKGLVIGFSIAAPVGPIGVLCIRRTLARGFVSGVTAGLGTATADAVYGAVAAFGLTAVMSFLVGHRLALGVVGGVFLCFLGCRVFFSRAEGSLPADSAGPKGGMGRRGDSGFLKASAAGGGYLSTFFLTIANPPTILIFVALFTGAGLVAAPNNNGSAACLVAGVFSGSALWWLVLSGATTVMKEMITTRTIRVLNYLAGVVIAGFGVFSIYSVL